jgi:pyruvate dehydrogenase E1 component beta subunit
MRMVLRCPVGGGRGYGPTHSQSLQKHFVGVPGLALYEVSPFRDQAAVLAEMLERGEPGVLFEDKVLYTRPMYEVPAPFELRAPDAEVAEVSLPGERPDCVVVAGGAVAHRVLDAMRSLLVEEELVCTLLVPSRLYPFGPDDLELPDTGSVFVVEEGTAGGTWGAEVAHVLHARHWSRLDRPVTLVHSADAVIPTAAHLERDMLVSAEAVHRTILETLRA